MTVGEQFVVYQVAIESILTKMLAEMPQEKVDDWLTNDSNLLAMADQQDEKSEFHRLVFGRIKEGVESRRRRYRN